MFNIRLAEEGDAGQIAKVHIDSWRAVYRDHMPNSVLDNLSLEKRKHEWHERLHAGVYVWVVEDNTQIVGFVSICPSRDSDADPTRVAEISAIYLLPECWRKGLGQKLCKVVFDEAAKKGFKEITLWVLENNIQAARFYEAQGFKATGDVEIDHIGCENLRVIRYKKTF